MLLQQTKTAIHPCFNPRAPGGARFKDIKRARDYLSVSIHAPPEGRDADGDTTTTIAPRFQSTRPRRGAINIDGITPQIMQVSIHAPPEGRDLQFLLGYAGAYAVSIHAPPEGRDYVGAVTVCVPTGFQSTRPRRGAIRIGKQT